MGKRFLVSPRNILPDGRVVLPVSEVRHLTTVLRMRPGDEVELFDGAGRTFRAHLETVGTGSATAKIDEEYPRCRGESPLDIELIPGGSAGSLLATTDPLPADFPTLITNVSNPAQMEPGYTLMDCFFRGGSPGEFYVIVVDNAGEVVWYSTKCGSGIRQLPNGILFYGVNQVLFHQDMPGYFVDLPLAATPMSTMT